MSAGLSLALVRELRVRGSAHRLRPTSPEPRASWIQREATLGQFDRQDRRQVAVVVTADGRRVHLPIDPVGLSDVSLLAQLRSLLGLDGLLGLITGSRRENGGTRRDERS